MVESVVKKVWMEVVNRAWVEERDGLVEDCEEGEEGEGGGKQEGLLERMPVAVAAEVRSVEMEASMALRDVMCVAGVNSLVGGGEEVGGVGEGSGDAMIDVSMGQLFTASLELRFKAGSDFD